VVLLKFWMHIGKDEQLRRFQERQAIPYKAWKLTAEDWRNRERWERYEEAVEEMLLKTSTLTAPWTIVEGNDKWWGRVKVLRTVADTLARELNFSPEILGDGADGKKKGKGNRADGKKKAKKTE
jgi:polyphosphate kinase 2 (PPK2 family)